MSSETSRDQQRLAAPDADRRGVQLGAVALALYATLASAVCLAGWFFSIPILTDWDSDGIAMFANPALAAARSARRARAWSPHGDGWGAHPDRASQRPQSRNRH